MCTHNKYLYTNKPGYYHLNLKIINLLHKSYIYSIPNTIFFYNSIHKNSLTHLLLTKSHK